MQKSTRCYKILFTLFILLQSGWMNAQNPSVSETVSNAFENGNGNDTYYASKAVIDHDGNINVATTYFGSYDIVILKYSPAGALMNQIFLTDILSLATSFYAIPENYMLMDNENNYYILGYHGSSYESLEIQKISASGSWIWTYDYPQYPINNVNYARSTAFTLDNDGNIVTGGSLTTTTSEHLGFMIKLSPAGQIIWSKENEFPEYDFSIYSKIIVDAAGNIFAAGAGASYFVVEKYDSNGILIWNTAYDTTLLNSSAYCLDMVLAPSGNIYATGYSSANSASDMITIKYNQNGKILWVKTYTGTGISSDVSHAVFIDGAENVYIAGESNNDVTARDLTAIKYNKNGLQQWVTSYPFSLQSNFSSELFVAALLDANNNLIVTGAANDTSGNPFSPYTKELYLRIDPQGNILYAGLLHAGEPFNQKPYALVQDGSGNIYSMGSRTNSLNHLPSIYTLKRSPNNIVLYELNYQIFLGAKEYHKSAIADISNNFYSANNISSGGNSHPRNSYRFDENGNQTLVNTYFPGGLNRMVRDHQHRILTCGFTASSYPDLTLCDSTGMQIWSRSLTSKGYATDIASDAAGNILVTGYYKPKKDSTDIFLAKYDVSGNQLWNITYSGAGLGNDEAYAMSIDNASNVFITGRTQSGGTYRALLLNYNSNGILTWSLVTPSANNAHDFGYDVVADNTGGCYVTGRFTQTQPGLQGFVVIKVSANGALQKKLYRTGIEQSSTDFGTHLFLDQNNDLYAEGRVMKGGKPYGISIMKLKSNLQLKWMVEKSGFNYAFDDSIGSVNSYNDPLQFAVDSKGKVYVANVLNGSYHVEISKLSKTGEQLWNYTSTVAQPQINPSPDLVCDNENNAWCVFNIFSGGLTGYDWHILKFDGSPSPLRMDGNDQSVVAESKEDLSLTLFPNPAQQTTTLFLSHTLPGRVVVSIHNMLNEEVYYSIENCKKNSYEKTVSLQQLPAGIYGVTVSINNKQVSGKLLKK